MNYREQYDAIYDKFLRYDNHSMDSEDRMLNVLFGEPVADNTPPRPTYDEYITLAVLELYALHEGTERDVTERYGLSAACLRQRAIEMGLA